MLSQRDRLESILDDRRAAFRLALLYLVVGGAWILFSDSALAWLVSDPGRLAVIQLFKGWFYVLVTAGFAYWLVARLLKSRTQVADTLRESEQRYRSLFEDCPVSLWEEDFSGVKTIIDNLRQSGVTDLRSHFEAHPELLRECARAVRVLDVNRATLDLLGYDRRDELRSSLEEVFREESYRLFLDELVHLSSGGTAYQLETVNQRREGEPVYVKMSVRIVPGCEETWARVFVTLTDLTARVKAERTLRSEKNFSDTMIESMPGVLYFYDMEGRFLRWNRNFETVSGYSAQEIARMQPTDFFGESEKPLLEERIAEVFRKGESSVEANFVTKSGVEIPYFFTGRRVVFDGKLCLVGMGIDISERRRAQEKLAESERKYRELVEHANSIILRWNADGRITMLNEFGQRFFGYSAEEILGQPVIGTIVPSAESTGRDLETLMEEIRSSPETFEQNINENIRRNGERVWIAWTNRIVLDSNGKVAEILSVGADITARKQAEAEREKRHQAEAADRIKSAFLATMSHELRTPLNSIIGFTGIILQGLAGPLNAEQTKQLGMVLASARHLLALVNDVLDISKIEAGQFEVSREPFDLVRSIEKALSIVQPQADAKGLDLRASVARELDRAVGDERRFEQILLNLLTNAVKFTEQGEVGLIAELVPDYVPPGGGSPELAVRVKVVDTGMGIKPENLPQLFQPFRQIDSGLSRGHDGTGLGLAICRRLATLMGGEIQVESEWEKGSAFTVTLPLQGRERG